LQGKHINVPTCCSVGLLLPNSAVRCYKTLEASSIINLVGLCEKVYRFQLL